MPSRSPETDPKALLGELLRLARLESEYKTQDAVGRAIGMERSTIGKGEQGERMPNVHVLGDWLTACGVTGLARAAIEGVARLARNTAEDSPVKIWFSGYLEAEGKAHTLRLWQPLVFHGLFQTEAYARALFAAMGTEAGQAEQMVDLRMERQTILAGPQPPNIVALFDESVLHRLVGSPKVMHEQLTRLLELPGNVVIQVVPSDIGANAGLGGAITLAAGSGTPEVLGSEAMVEDQVTADVPLVLKASATFDRVRADALNRVESRNRLTEALKRWNS
jgi:transcriptional regulator with XRE-family HTH domain